MPKAPALADDAALAAVAEQGRALILSLQDVGGAYPASPTFSVYRGYAWLRDGAFIADGMSSAGAVDSATAFFDWCNRMLVLCEGRIGQIVSAAASGTPVEDQNMLPTRFAIDEAADETDWWDFQLDGYGLWVWAAIAHAERHGLDGSRWRRGIELTIDYLVSSWNRPCYDWWEEHVEEVHVSTLGSVIAGLRAAAGAPFIDADRAAAASGTAEAASELLMTHGTSQGHLIKWIGSTEVDASLASLFGPLGVVEASGPLGLSTIAELDRQLTVGGGVHR
ncbi:MAG: glycoside hydrolase family 15 protein, partial [Pseudolysinimonas sp.]